MEELLTFAAVTGAAGLGAVALYDKAYPERRIWARIGWLVLTWPWQLAWAAAKGGVSALQAGGVEMPSIFGPPKVRHPETHELVKRQTADPTRPAGAEHGSWPILGRGWKAVHCNVTSEPGGANGQTAINYAIKHHLEHSPEHAIIVDVKPELDEIVRRYGGPEDRIFLYTSHGRKPKSSALDLFSDIDMAAEVGRILTRPEDSNEPYWAKKAAALVAANARRLRGAGGGAVSLSDIYDIVSDRKTLEALRDRDPLIDNVADNVKEWGSIRSNSLQALEVLAIPRVRRMVDPLPKTSQPEFSAWGGRTIVIIQPSEELGDTLAPLISAMLHVLYMRAAAGGWGGGPGTKVYADEAASFMALDRLPRYLELGRGRLVQLMYVLQSRKQLVDVLGEERADRVLAATELQFIGATTDLGTAEFLERLSGPARVHYRGPRNLDGKRPWSEHMRPKVQAHEITGQEPGEWTARHHADVWKFRVPNPAGFFYMQPHPDPQPLRIYGIPKREV